MADEETKERPIWASFSAQLSILLDHQHQTRLTWPRCKSPSSRATMTMWLHALCCCVSIDCQMDAMMMMTMMLRTTAKKFRAHFLNFKHNLFFNSFSITSEMPLKAAGAGVLTLTHFLSISHTMIARLLCVSSASASTICKIIIVLGGFNRLQREAQMED